MIYENKGQVESERPEVSKVYTDQHNKNISGVDSPYKGKNQSDIIFKYTLLVIGAGFPIYMLYLYLSTLVQYSKYAVNYFGVNIFINDRWNPNGSIFGVNTFLFGTIFTSLIAIVIALPISILAGIFIYEYTPTRFKDTLRGIIDLLAGIPSVLYGLWGIFVLIPILTDHVYPFFGKILNVKIDGYSILTAGFVLAIMIIPILVNIIMEGFDTVPVTLREAMTGLGATRWEVSRHVTIGTTKSTIFVALMLGLGRALGETLAVTMVIGNNNNPPDSILHIFSSGQTMSSLLANEFGEATSRVYISVLFEVALILFVVTAIFNMLGMIILKRLKR